MKATLAFVAGAFPESKLFYAMSDASSFEREMTAKLKALQARVAELEEAQRQQAESESSLHTRLSFLSRAFYHCPESLIITRLDDSTVIDVNEAGCRITGYARDEIIGRKITEIQAWENVEDREQFVAELKENGQVTDFETMFRHGDGWVGSFLISARIVEVEGVQYIVSTGRDLRQRELQEAELDESLQTSSDLLEFSPAGLIVYEYQEPRSLRLVTANPEAMQITGIDVEEVTGREFDELWPAARELGLTDKLLEVMRTGVSYRNEELAYSDSAISGVYRLVAFRIPGNQLAVGFEDITKLKESESERELTIQLLQLIHKDIDLHELMASVTGLMQQWSGCEAVGVRLKRGDDYPYFETRGFPSEFVRAEKYLCAKDEQGKPLTDCSGSALLECICGSVLSGKTNPGQPYYTARGSFWTNSTTELVSSFNQEELSQIRNRCHRQGYESIALIPLRTSKGTFGLLQFNDSREYCFTPHRISLFERLADSIAAGLAYRRAIEALEQNEARYRTLFETAKEGFYICRKDVVVDCNPAGCEMIGSPDLEGVVGRSIAQLSPRNQLDERASKEKSLELINSALKGNPQRFTWQGLGLDGELTYFDISLVGLSPVEDQLTLGVVRDVTEQMKVEAALRASEQRLSNLIANLPGFVYKCAIDSDWTMQFLSEGCLDITGYQPEEILNNAEVSYAGIIHPEDRLPVEQGVLRQLESGTTFEIEYRIVRKDGTERWVWEHGISVEDENGERYLEGYVVDTTDRRLAEDTLRANEQRLSEAEKLARVGGWEHDLITGEAFWTDTLYDIIEIEGGPIPGVNEHLDYYAENDREELREAYQRAIDTGESFNLELQCRTARGRVFWARVIGKPEYSDGDCVRMQGTFQDITERKEAEAAQQILEAQLRQSQKMEAVGQLAGGIAHDFNNILTAILGNVELLHLGLLKMLEPGDPLLDWLIQVAESAQRAADLTHQLLAFSRKQLISPKVLDPAALVSGMEDMLRRVIREDIELSLTHIPGVLNIRADSGQIEQVILNLVVNARDALPNGGRIEITIRSEAVDTEQAVHMPDLQIGDYVVISVSDNGHGIPEDLLEHIFEPFFTTKPSGEGTGLGLAMVHGIVKQSHGHVKVESREGEGSHFEVYLPAVFESVKGQTVDAVDEQAPSGSETVLVCEDDAAVRRLAVHSLQARGYLVFEAENAAEAVQISDSIGRTLDMLVTDVIMPGTNGKELADQLALKFPELRVLFVSGYTADVIGDHGVLQAGVEFLEKPYSSSALLDRVRSVLDKDS